MGPTPQRPAPGFRLNAPQAESQAENGSGEFAGLGDEIEDGFTSVNYGVDEDDKVDDKAELQERRLSRSPRPSLTLEQHRQILVQQQVDAQLRQQVQQQIQMQHQQQVSQQQQRAVPYKFLIAIGIVIIFLLIGLITTVVVILGGDDSSSDKAVVTPGFSQPSTNPATTPPEFIPTSAPTVSPTRAVVVGPTTAPKTTLGRVFQRGKLYCGVSDGQPGFSEVDSETGERLGIDAELCRALAAAIFGDYIGHLDFVPVSGFDRFTNLLYDEYDVMVRATTHTMERQVLEPTTGGAFAFSVPYLYNGLQFGGIPEFVACTDNITISEGFCDDLKVCVLDGTTHVDIVAEKFPNVQILSAVTSEYLYTNFLSGACNVIAGEQFDIAESILRNRGYTGDYDYGIEIHSKEPLCMVTRADDAEWSDFVNWVLQALLAAEDQGIIQQTADLIPETDAFGEGSQFALAFRYAVRAVGNLAEIYLRTLEAILPRPVADTINKGSTGLIYSFPFGNFDVVGSNPESGSTLAKIQARGFLKCGISTRVIFANFDESTQTWDGFDVDYCKALSAAIFDGVTDTVEYTDLSASSRFTALADGDVDVLSRLTTVTASRDILEPTAGVGFSFSQPNFYDGLTFGGIPPYPACADELDVISSSCQDLLICVIEGTTFEIVLKTLFPDRFVVPLASIELSVEGLVNGGCNVIAGGVVDVSLTNVRLAGYQGNYQTGSSRYSKDPLALVTRQDDFVWSSFVFWIVASTFYAEEEGITKATASMMPEVSLFGPRFGDMFRVAIGAVGNYGEIYNRQAQAEVPRGGLNELNDFLKGPLHYPLPGVIVDG